MKTYLLVFLGLVIANAICALVWADASIMERCIWQGVALFSHWAVCTFQDR